MKKTTLILSILFCLLSLESIAQKKNKFEQEKIEKRKQDSIILAFPEFIDGVVYFKNQTKNNAKLNYNHYKQELLFMGKDANNEDAALKVDNMSEISFVVMDDRSFIPIGTALGEILVNDIVGLVLSKKVNVLEKKVGAYGTGGSTASISNVQSIQGSGQSSGSAQGAMSSPGQSATSYSGTNHSGSANQHTFSADVEFKNDERLFLMKDLKVYPLTKKNLLKRFPKISDFIDQYIEENNPDFSDEEDMIKFVSICNGQAKM